MNDFFEPDGPLFTKAQKQIASRVAPAPSAEVDFSVKEIRKSEFAKRLHSLLMEKSWNQSDLARHSGMGRDSISQYVRGNNSPSPKNLKKLADALGVDPVELYPNYEAAAVDREIPALSFRQMVGDDEHMWVRINKKIHKSVATKIMVLLNE